MELELYIVTHESLCGKEIHLFRTETDIVWATYGPNSIIKDPNHLKIIKELAIDFRPDLGDFINISAEFEHVPILKF